MAESSSPEQRYTLVSPIPVDKPSVVKTGFREAEEEATSVQEAPWPIDSRITWRNRRDHFLARWGYRRGDHRARPGLYALGRPTAESPVFVTANYTLSFDALRSALADREGYLLVLDTQGINVWCAAGKGTFGTDELVRRIRLTGLTDRVSHRRLVLPQLGAPGVSAHEVRRRSGFRVEYGPVRADDLPAYLEAGAASPEMRRVTFTFQERLVLVPVELVSTLVPMLLSAIVLYFLSGLWGAVGIVLAVLAGAFLFPLLLPWLPSRDFSSKGYILGGIALLPVLAGSLGATAGAPWWARLGTLLAYSLGFPSVTAYLALNFTGATPLASKSGVKREMSSYIRWMVVAAGLALILLLGIAIARWIGG